MSNRFNYKQIIKFFKQKRNYAIIKLKIDVEAGRGFYFFNSVSAASEEGRTELSSMPWRTAPSGGG